MISPEAVKEVLQSAIEEQGLFLVDIHVGASNNIKVEVDSYEGFNIDNCVKLNRVFEAAFDREVEDYALEVSSPGLDQPFRVWDQYKKNVGRELDIVLNNGEKRSGLLKDVSETSITLEKTERKKVEGKKKKELVTTTNEFVIEDIKKAFVKLSFK